MKENRSVEKGNLDQMKENGSVEMGNTVSGTERS